MSNTFDKLSVLDSFIEEVNSYLPEIEANLGRLAQSTDDMEALEESYRRAHTIGGSASMMDFPGLAHVAHGMEDILGDVLDNLATIDPPTLGLLHRSLERIHRLVDGIHKGIDENAIIAEDDADYTQYRAQIELAARATTDQSGALPSPDAQTQVGAPASANPAPAIPSLDEMLASFLTPGVPAGEEVAWPEDPQPVSGTDARTRQDTQPEQILPAHTPAPSEPVHTSTLEMLATPAPRVPERPPVTPSLPVADEDETVREWHQEPVPAVDAVRPITHAPVPLSGEYGTPMLAQEDGASVARIYQKMQEDARVLEDQASVFRRTLTQLRLAATVVEAQRTEFKGFLDGSKDALDRMEEWAGKAMGLNLRNSPEQVRRYLPLSVMWVANSKLKKVLELLVQMTGSVEMTDEQMQGSIAQLQSSIDACGQAIDQIQTASPAQSWSPWEAQVSHDTVHERVTFERSADIAALRAEIEAQLREEYERRPMTVAARAELERQIRAELREEYDARRQLQESVIGTGSSESLQALEARLRQEIEIAVRSEFLTSLTGEMDEAPGAALVDRAAIPAAPVAGSPASVVPALPVMPPQSAPATSYVTPQAADFGEEAAEIFKLEAEEHLQTISMFVARLESAPNNLEPIQGIRRATHTLKGAAGMMGFRAIADLCHISEDLLDSVMEETIPITPAVVSIILDTAEALDMLINAKGPASEGQEAVESLRKRYNQILGEQPSLASAMNEELEADIEASEAVILQEAVAKNVVDASQEEVPVAGLEQMARGDLSVRVPLTKLDELVNLFGELLVNRSILEERLQRLVRLVSDTGVSSNRLRDVGQKLESRFEAATLPSGRSVQVMPGEGNMNVNGRNGVKNANGKTEPAHLAEFDELELDRYTEFHQLARGLSEGISDMTTLSNEMDAIIRDCEAVFSRENRLNTTFQDRLMKARLVPLSTMIPRLYRTARAVALKQHKEFEFVLEGQETEVDRTVIEEIAGPLLHLMRNAVNHAIETPEVRLERGKPAAGQIKLSAAYEGNQVVIMVRDDGTGIDPQRVRNSAIARGFITPDQQLSESDIIELIFRPGFSTAEVLSEESGRGVGLDVVRDSVSRLRGTLEVESMPGQGTAFTMKFPTSLAIQSTMMVTVGEYQYAIPTVMVEAIGRMDNFKQSTSGGRPAIVVQNDLYPLIMLSQLLELPSGPVDEKAPVLLVRTDRHRVALVVDSIRGKLDVVMKNLGPHLRHVHGIAGGTVLGNGRVVLILELIELLSPRPGTRGFALNVPTSSPLRRDRGTTATAQNAVALAGAAVPVAPATQAPTPRGTTVTTAPVKQAALTGKHILVVDDSPSVRRVVGNMLKQNGWDVQLARDGVEALEMISRETPAAVLLDIEMPRMDGYELMATVRAQEQYRTLPLVVLTSRAAAKHQQRAMQLGASAYVVKPYQDEELLNILKSLVYGATV